MHKPTLRPGCLALESGRGCVRWSVTDIVELAEPGQVSSLVTKYSVPQPVTPITMITSSKLDKRVIFALEEVMRAVPR